VDPGPIGGFGRRSHAAALRDDLVEVATLL
jgi:hypothetical protein